MIAHYFAQAPDATQVARLERILSCAAASGKGVSPAMLEQMCAMHATVEKLLEGLSTHVGEVITTDESQVQGLAGSEMNAMTAKAMVEVPVVMVKRSPSGG